MARFKDFYYGMNPWQQLVAFTEWTEKSNKIQARHKGAEVKWIKNATAKEIEDARCYYNSKKIPKVRPIYETFPEFGLGYNHRNKRDDRVHSVRTLEIHKEEEKKAVPTRSSSLIGHRATLGKLEPIERSHVRVTAATKGFLRSRGVGLAPDLFLS